jgi:prophage tail gpP-like protein
VIDPAKVEPEVSIRIGGLDWRQWDRLEISMAIEELARSVTLAVWDDREDAGVEFPFGEGDELEIDVGTGRPGGKERVLTGYIGRVTMDDGPTHSRVDVTGASKTIDLIETSGPVKRWKNVPKLKIASDLADPYGISVSSTFTLANAEKFKVEPEETPFDALHRLAQSEAAMLMTDADGNVVFDRTSTTAIRTKLRRGDNILRSMRVGDYSERGSTYTVISQRGSTKLYQGKEAAQMLYELPDAEVARHRPMLFLMDGKGTQSELERRARHELHTRTARAKIVSYGVAGWHHWEGLWLPNQLVGVEDERYGIRESLLISRVVLQVDARHGSEGFATHLDLARPDSFDIDRDRVGKDWMGG